MGSATRTRPRKASSRLEVEDHPTVLTRRIGRPPASVPSRERTGRLRYRLWRSLRVERIPLGRPLPRRPPREVLEDLRFEVEAALRYAANIEEQPLEGIPANADEIVRKMASVWPRIAYLVETDVNMAIEEDPALRASRGLARAEVVLAYEGLQAVATHRIAHELEKLGVPFLPRMMSERAKRLSGIDIHPGATIGESFFIDHGTGVVIGQTAIIGKRVRLYQNVTLGASNFPRSVMDGTYLREVKRHPTIGDDVVIWSDTAILGDITIGRGSVIAAGLQIFHDIAEDTLVRRVRADVKHERGYEKMPRVQKPAAVVESAARVEEGRAGGTGQ